MLLIAKRSVPDRLGPAIGFVITLISTAGFIHRLAPRLTPSPTVGTGGYIGATVAIFLEAYFHLTGMILILAAIGLFGLALCHEVLFVWPFQELRGWIAHRWRRRGTGFAHKGGPGSMIVVSDAPDRDHPIFAPASSAHPVPSLAAPGAPAAGGEPGLRRLSAPGTALQQPNANPGAYMFPALEPGAPFELPPIEILEPATSFPVQEHEAQVSARAMLLERTLLDFGYQVRVVQIDTGPVITQFEIELEAGLRVSKIMSLADDLAIALAVPSVPHCGPDSQQDDGRHRGAQ